MNKKDNHHSVYPSYSSFESGYAAGIKNTMKSHPGIALFTKLCIASFFATLILFGISSASDHTGEIVYGYFAFLAFLFLSLPLHLLGIPLTIYTGLKSKDHRELAWQYAYFGAWFAIHAVVFGPFLFQKIPELATKAVFSATHQAEIELARTVARHEPDPAKVKRLIDDGVDVNQVDRYIGYPPLVWAARQGNAEIVDMLVEAGADVHVVIDKQAYTGVLNELFVPEITPLGFASVTKDNAHRLALVRKLLDLGVDPDRGYAVLGACAFGDVVTLEALLAAGADPDIGDLNGFSCGHAAAYNGRLDMLTYLIEHEHVLDDRNKHNRGVLDIAIFNHHEETVLMLLQQGFRPRSDDGLERFLNQEPTNTEVKTRIRERFLEPPNND
jgi:ankyrin repeat protein